MDLAASIQAVTEDVLLRMVRHVHAETGQRHLCLAGGVALNCVANSRILREGPFDDIWIQPAAGDAGGALGAALSVWHRFLGKERPHPKGRDSQRGSYLGPAFSSAEVRRVLDDRGCPYHPCPREERPRMVAEQIASGKIVGYLVGRMEYGPRALGARSILGDPRRDETQSVMNLKIKYRESFRPFAPSVPEERVSEYFDSDRASPYMLLVAKVREERRFPQPASQGRSVLERLKVRRSDLPAITHLDYSARLQTVARDQKPDFWAVMGELERLTGCAVVVNTSFNVRGEPIVCTPEEAYRCFMRTEMDVLVMEESILFKEEQPPWTEGGGWRRDLVLD
jgi:carbamoyltransferase